MGCCFSGSRKTSTGYVPDSEDSGGCSLASCLCCLCCFCVYPCLPHRGGGGYPSALHELEDFTSTQALLDQDNLAAYHELQNTRVAQHEPIAMQWEDLVDSLETGDLVLFKGSGVGSVLITTFTGRWSHVAMVYTKCVDRENKVVLLWESVSHPDECLDVPTQTFKDGARLVDLRQRLLKSDSPYYGIVKVKIPSRLRRGIQLRFEQFVKSEIHKPYEPNRMNLVRVAFDCGLLGHNERTKDSYFCSKLIGETLAYVGVVSPDVNSSLICPTDFWDYTLKLHNGCRVQTLIFMPRIKQQASEPPQITGKNASAELELLIEHDTTLHSPLLKSPVQIQPQQEDKKQRRKKSSSDFYKLH